MKIKKYLFYSIISVFFALSFISLSSVASKAAKLEYCSIGNSSYLLPKQVAITSYTTTIDENAVLPLSEIYTQVSETNITKIYDLNNESDCTSFSVTFSKMSEPSGKLTEYTIKNMLLDTYENGYWSYYNNDIYKNNRTISFSGSYYYYEEFRINIANSTDYKVLVNGDEFINNTTSSYNMDYHNLQIIFIDNDGNNMSDNVTIDGTNYTYDYESKAFLIDARNHSSDFIWLTCKNKEPAHKEFTIISFYDFPKTTNEILQTVNVSDNIDGNIVDSIEIISDTYTGNETILGEYSIILSASDSSKNTATCLLTIHVVDKTAPVVEGDSTLYGLLSNPKEIETIILNSFYINDEYDGDISNSLVVGDNNYNKNIPGTYDITFWVNDNSNNITETTFQITIKDDIPPVYTIDNSYYIYTCADEYLDIDDMVYVLKRDINIDNTFISYEIYEDSYSASYNKEGEYKVTLKFIYDDREEIKSLNVIVDENETSKTNTSKRNYVIYASILFIVCASILFVRKINKAISN